MQGFKAVSHDRRVVDKYVLATILSDKPEAFLIVPPFDFAFSHKPSPESFEAAQKGA